MTELKITGIDVYKSNIPLVNPFRIAVMETTHAENLFVRIATDGGPSGLGEASPTAALTGETQAIDAAAAVDLARLLLGKDPLDVESRVGELERFLAHNSSIRSAFDMASKRPSAFRALARSSRSRFSMCPNCFLVSAIVLSE